MVLLVLEDFLEPVFLARYVIAHREHLLITLGVGVAVHDVQIGLRIVLQHHIVPGERICAPQITSIDDGELPVFTVIDLSSAREHERYPHGSDRIWAEGSQLAWLHCPLQQTVGHSRHGCRVYDYRVCGQTVREVFLLIIWQGPLHESCRRRRFPQPRIGMRWDSHAQSCYGQQHGPQPASVYIPLQYQLFRRSNISMMRSSSSSLAKGMVILPLPFSEQVICTLVWKNVLRLSRSTLYSALSAEPF